MHADLEAEGLEASIVATCEQRIEEVHARIFEANASVGRNFDPPSTSAKICLNENLFMCRNWIARAFVLQNWKKHLLTEVLAPIDSVTEEFKRTSSEYDRVLVVYH